MVWGMAYKSIITYKRRPWQTTLRHTEQDKKDNLIEMLFITFVPNNRDCFSFIFFLFFGLRMLNDDCCKFMWRRLFLSSLNTAYISFMFHSPQSMNMIFTCKVSLKCDKCDDKDLVILVLFSTFIQIHTEKKKNKWSRHHLTFVLIK